MGDSTERATSDISRDIDEDGNVSFTHAGGRDRYDLPVNSAKVSLTSW